MERRFWYGTGILLLFLGLGLLATWGMETMHCPVTAYLDQAAEAAMAGDEAAAETLAQAAKTAWQNRRNLTATMADHAPMEEIDSLFSQMEVYARIGNQGDFAAYCTRIARLVEAIGEAHSLTWQNVI